MFPCVSYNRGNPNLLTFELFVIIYLSERLWCSLITGESMFRIIHCYVTKVRHVQSHSSLPRRCSVEQREALRQGTNTQPEPTVAEKIRLSPSQRNPRSGSIEQHQQSSTGLCWQPAKAKVSFFTSPYNRSTQANKNMINTFFKLPHFSAKCHFKGVGKITDNAVSTDLKLSCSFIISALSLLWLFPHYIILWQHLDTSEKCWVEVQQRP